MARKPRKKYPRHSPRPTGRPSKYTPELGRAICDQLAVGKSLRDICDTAGMPHRLTVLRWQTDNSEFRNQYVAARDHMVDALAEKVIRLAETATAKNVNQRRFYGDTIKWYTGKVAPKKYGDKLDLNVTGKVTIGDAIEQGRQRVAKLRGNS